MRSSGLRALACGEGCAQVKPALPVPGRPPCWTWLPAPARGTGRRGPTLGAGVGQSS